MADRLFFSGIVLIGAVWLLAMTPTARAIDRTGLDCAPRLVEATTFEVAMALPAAAEALEQGGVRAKSTS
jgi:hypothetical protein